MFSNKQNHIIFFNHHQLFIHWFSKKLYYLKKNKLIQVTNFNK